MLSDVEVKRIVEAISEYKELVEQSSDMRDKLEQLQKRWNSLRQEREQVRNSLDSLHQVLSQLKVDYQQIMKRVNDLSSTEDTVLDNVRFLLDELIDPTRRTPRRLIENAIKNRGRGRSATGQAAVEHQQGLGRRVARGSAGPR